MFKKHMTPLTKGGSLVKNAGKGSQQAPMPGRQMMNSLSSAQSPSFNNYAKATPMAQPSQASTPGSSDGLGSGNWPGIGQ